MYEMAAEEIDYRVKYLGSNNGGFSTLLNYLLFIKV
jgi:hypothetical protein